MGGMEPDHMAALLAENICPYCLAGPWRSVAAHSWQKHQIRASQIKEEAGIPKSRSLICAETKAILGDRALERDSIANARGMLVVGKTANASDAGRAVWRANMALAAAVRTRIRPEDHAPIRVRIASGETKKAIASDFGVSVSRIRQIEQGIAFVYTRTG